MQNRVSRKSILLFISFGIINSALCTMPFEVASKPAAKPAGPKQYIFSRSSRPTTSSALGITGVPAYVNFPNGSQQCGIYVMQCTPGGSWASMGLKPGRVLLTVDGRGAQSPSSLDSMLSNKSGTMDYTYVRLSDGLPELIRNRVNYGGPAMGTASGIKTPPVGSGMIVEDNTPISQLESQMVGLINKDRSSNGQHTLSDNARLSELARTYATFLVTHGAFNHEADGRDPMGRAKAHGIGGGIAENLAFEARTRPDKDSLVIAQGKFMAEPPNVHNHRWNILWSDAKSVGVGIVRGGGRIMMVQEFSDGTP